MLVARRRAEQRVPRHRFGLAYLALAALLGAAVGLFVVLVGHGGSGSGPGWSAWKPAQTGVQGRGRDRHLRRATSTRSRTGGSSSACSRRRPRCRARDRRSPCGHSASPPACPARPRRRAVLRRARTRRAYVLCGFGSAASARSAGKATAARARPAPPRGARARPVHVQVRVGRSTRWSTFMPPARRSADPTSALFFQREDSRPRSRSRSRGRCRAETGPRPGPAGRARPRGDPPLHATVGRRLPVPVPAGSGRRGRCMVLQPGA